MTSDVGFPQPIPPPVPPPEALPDAYLPPPPPAPPAVWPAVVVPVVAIVVAALAAGVALAAAAIADAGPAAVTDDDRFRQWVKTYAARPQGFLLLILPGQLTFMAAAITAGAVSRREPVARRLGLKRPTTPWWVIPLLLLATPFASLCGDLLTTALFGDDRGEHLEMLNELFRGHSGAMLLLVTLTVSVLPGFGEELLFRGYAQQRLLQRWHPALAIGFTSLLFAAAHFDAVHIVGVLPLGIWLGVVAWLSGSIWFAVICHAANNALAVLVVNAGLEGATEHVRFDATGLIQIGVTGGFVALSVWVMLRYRQSPTLAATPATPVAVSDLGT